jgi:isochorismate synthase
VIPAHFAPLAIGHRLSWQAAWRAYQTASVAVFLKPAGGQGGLSFGVRQCARLECAQDLEAVAGAALERAEGERVAFLMAFQPDSCRGLWRGLPPGVVLVPEQWVPAPGDWPQQPSPEVTARRPQHSRLRPGHSDWTERVQRTTEAIAAGQIDKAVLARRLDLTYDHPIDVPGTVAELVRASPAATVWSWRVGGQDFVGASPELLVSYRQGRLQTACLAGTLIDGAAGAGGAWQDKERREQAVVESYVDRAFRTLGLTPVHSGLSEVHQGSFRHLTATVEAKVDSASSFYALLTLLHPTPALAGEPRTEALAWIRRQEPFGRGYYGGVVGWVEATGEAHAVVAIRCALLSGPKAHLFAGGGLVRGSEPDAEWRETGAKLRVVQGALERGGRDGRR